MVSSVPLSIPILFTASRVASARQQTSPYDTYAPTYDVLDGGAAATALGFADLRAALIGQAQGNVLEVGVGTGLNLPLYDWKAVTTITGADLSPGMLQEAQNKIQGLARPDAVTLRTADVEALPFEDDSFDCVVDTFSMCVFAHPSRALAEMARVLRPGGRLLLLEHSRSTSALVGWYQDVTAPAVAATGKGCFWNQRVVELVQGTPGIVLEGSTVHLGGLLTSVVAVKPVL